MNAGQVFGTRAAENIAVVGLASAPENKNVTDVLCKAVEHIAKVLQPDSAHSIQSVRSAVQARMSDMAGIICRPTDVSAALSQAHDLCTDIQQNGIGYGRANEIGRVIQWQQMAVASLAVLAALDHYIQHGGGSRGARAICDPTGDGAPDTVSGPLDDYRFRKERSQDQQQQIFVYISEGGVEIVERPNRALDAATRSFFERDWPAWLTGSIHDPSPKKDTAC